MVWVCVCMVLELSGLSRPKVRAGYLTICSDSHLLTYSFSAPKCQNNENEVPEDKVKPDPLDPKNIADSIVR